MAVLVLKNADFSANYVKKIDIFGGFSDTTKAVFNRCGITADESNQMQLSVDTFINRLVTAGLWGTKIKSLCIPFLSEMGANGALATAQLNIVDGSNFFKSNVSGSLSLSSHGLACVNGGSAVKVNLTDYATITDIHLAAYNMTEETQQKNTAETHYCDKYVYGAMTGILGVLKMVGTQVASTPFPQFFVASNNKANGDVNYRTASALLIASIRAGGNPVLATNGQVASASSTTTTSNSLSNPYFGCYNISTYTDDLSNTIKVYTKASWGLLSVGSGMSNDEMSAYTTAVNDLMADVATYLA